MWCWSATSANGQSVVERDGERLFDHDGDAVLGGDLDGMAMLGDGGVDENRLGVAALDHVGLALEEERVGELILLLVLCP